MKKIMCIISSGIIAFALTGCNSNTNTSPVSSTVPPSALPESASTITFGSSSTLLTSETSNESQANPPAPRETAIGKSDKSIDDLSFSPKATTVRNDVTGNWRYSGLSEPELDISQFALSYYNNCFKSDKEIHAIINFSNKTTTRIISFDGYSLSVTILRYVNGEEKDAKLMFSGDPIREYNVYIDNGDIELLYDIENENQ